MLLLILFTNCKKPGCTDPAATNYNSKANISDSSCLYDTNSLKNLTLNVYHYFDSSEFSFDSIYQDDFGNKILSIKPKYNFIKPSELEIKSNPRARSAKLRTSVKI